MSLGRKIRDQKNLNSLANLKLTLEAAMVVQAGCTSVLRLCSYRCLLSMSWDNCAPVVLPPKQRLFSVSGQFCVVSGGRSCSEAGGRDDGIKGLSCSCPALISKHTDTVLHSRVSCSYSCRGAALLILALRHSRSSS